MPDIISLSTEHLKQILTLENVIHAVKEAFINHSNQKGLNYPIVRERLNETSVFGIKSGYIEDQQTLGLKAAGYWANNRKEGLDCHQATILLLDPYTGRPKAFMDGNFITTIRTGAAGAVAADLFSSKKATKLAVIGTGVQGIIQSEGVLHVRSRINEIRCFNHSNGRTINDFVEHFKDRVNVTVCETVKEAIEDADIIVTATPSTNPLILAEYLKPGVHINAMGSDTKGKKELHPSILETAEIFVDDRQQSRSIGELQGLSHCEISAEIGEVLVGKHPGRRGDSSITVFDSSGISLQDLTTASLALSIAIEQGIGSTLSW